MDWSEELLKYSEFSDIDDMSDVDAIVMLLTLSKRYKEVAEIASKEATRALKSLGVNECTSSDGRRVYLKKRTSSKVDADVLAYTHPGIYKALCDAHEVSVSLKNLKDEDISDCISTSVSEWAELSR